MKWVFFHEIRKTYSKEIKSLRRVHQTLKRWHTGVHVESFRNDRVHKNKALIFDPVYNHWVHERYSKMQGSAMTSPENSV